MRTVREILSSHPSGLRPEELLRVVRAEINPTASPALVANQAELLGTPSSRSPMGAGGCATSPPRPPIPPLKHRAPARARRSSWWRSTSRQSSDIPAHTPTVSGRSSRSGQCASGQTSDGPRRPLALRATSPCPTSSPSGSRATSSGSGSLPAARHPKTSSPTSPDMSRAQTRSWPTTAGRSTSRSSTKRWSASSGRRSPGRCGGSTPSTSPSQSGPSRRAGTPSRGSSTRNASTRSASGSKIDLTGLVAHDAGDDVELLVDLLRFAAAEVEGWPPALARLRAVRRGRV